MDFILKTSNKNNKILFDLEVKAEQSKRGKANIYREKEGMKIRKKKGKERQRQRSRKKENTRNLRKKWKEWRSS